MAFSNRLYKMDVPTLISLTGFWCSDFEASMLKVFTAIMFVFWSQLLSYLDPRSAEKCYFSIMAAMLSHSKKVLGVQRHALIGVMLISDSVIDWEAVWGVAPLTLW